MGICVIITKPVLDNSSSDRVPGVEAPENFQEPEIWKNKNRQKERIQRYLKVKLQDYDHMQGGEKRQPGTGVSGKTVVKEMIM